jgi:hypothetical protein
MALTGELTTIILHFPQRMWGGWMDLKVMHASIKWGGFPFMTWKDVGSALKGLTKDPRVHNNKIGNVSFRDGNGRQATKLKHRSSLILLEEGLHVMQDAQGCIWIKRDREEDE